MKLTARAPWFLVALALSLFANAAYAGQVFSKKKPDYVAKTHSHAVRAQEHRQRALNTGKRTNSWKHKVKASYHQKRAGKNALKARRDGR
jgi:hypothetical protein